MHPERIGEGAKAVDTPKFCRPAASGVQNRIIPTGWDGRFCRFAFVSGVNGQRKLEIMRGGWDFDPKRSTDKLQALANYVCFFRDGNPAGKEEPAGWFAQVRPRKAKNSPRA